jgi:hypothetical protein
MVLPDKKNETDRKLKKNNAKFETKILEMKINLIITFFLGTKAHKVLFVVF